MTLVNIFRSVGSQSIIEIHKEEISPEEQVKQGYREPGYVVLKDGTVVLNNVSYSEVEDYCRING